MKIFNKNNKIEELKKENDELKKENERLKSYEKIYEDLISQCHQMKDEYRRIIALAKKAQANYTELYRNLSKNEIKNT